MVSKTVKQKFEKVKKKFLLLLTGINRHDTQLDGEERAGCFAGFVFLVSCDCCVALPRGEVCLQFMIVVYPDHTHLLCTRYIDVKDHIR